MEAAFLLRTAGRKGAQEVGWDPLNWWRHPRAGEFPAAGFSDLAGATASSALPHTRARTRTYPLGSWNTLGAFLTLMSALW